MFGTTASIACEEGPHSLWMGKAPGLHRQYLFGGWRIGLFEPVKSLRVRKTFLGDVPSHKKILATPTGMVMNEDVHSQGSPKIELDDLWSSVLFYMDNKGQDSSAASQSLMGLSTSLFNDVETFLMDKEDPAAYVPAPPISVADLQMNSQLEILLYKLREVIPGPMVKVGMNKKLSEVWSFVSDNIKVQDPMLCFEGKERLLSWLCTLATTNSEVHLDEIYSERKRDNSFKGYIHLVWTTQFPKDLPSISASSSSECEGSSSLQLNLSGESRLLVDTDGQVVSIESNWFVPKGGERELDIIKSLLTSLLLKEVHI